MLRGHPAAGFTLTELLVGIAVAGILLAIALPTLRDWSRASESRAASDALQSALRIARTEAIRRGQGVVLFRTAAAASDCATTAAVDANGANWVLRTIPWWAMTAETIRCGSLPAAATGVTVTGPGLLCFSPAGMMVANANPGLGTQTCTVPAAGRNTFVVGAGTRAERRVLVELSGSVRACNPARTLSDTAPDGCPT